MAPSRKRKATAAPTAEPPAKRQTRSSGTVKPQPATTKPAPRRRGRAKKPVEEVVEDEEVREDEEQDAEEEIVNTRATRSKAAAAPKARAARQTKASAGPSKPKGKRGRPPGKKAAVQRAESPEIPQASSSKVTIRALPGADEEVSEDELLLKSPSIRPVTPPKRVGSARPSATPRLVLDHVEVPTPSKRMREIQNLLSPRVTSPLKPPVSPVKAFPPRDTTPTRSAPSPKSSPARKTYSRLNDDARPVPVSPSSPSKALPVTPKKSPTKGKAVATPHASPSKLPRNLPPALHHALEAQKRATLKALQELSVLPREAESTKDEDEAIRSTNEIAYEQLTNLLRGTVERSEGNSCMVIGPRGSGKTQASLCQNVCQRTFSSHVRS